MQPKHSSMYTSRTAAPSLSCCPNRLCMPHSSGLKGPTQRELATCRFLTFCGSCLTTPSGCRSAPLQRCGGSAAPATPGWVLVCSAAWTSPPPACAAGPAFAGSPKLLCQSVSGCKVPCGTYGNHLSRKAGSSPRSQISLCSLAVMPAAAELQGVQAARSNIVVCLRPLILLAYPCQ